MTRTLKPDSSFPPVAIKPLWMTEQGFSTAQTGLLWPRFGVRSETLMQFGQACITGDALPIERSPHWYDTQHGFDYFPFMYNATTNQGALGPQLLPVRTMAAEIFGKLFAQELNFGIYGQNMYVGGRWMAPSTGAQVIGIQAASFGAHDVSLSVSSGTTFTYVDPWGNTATLTASGGKITFPAHELPGWVRIPAGTTCDLVAADWIWGSNFTTSATVTATGSQTNLSYLTDGVLRNQYDYASSDPLSTYGPYVDKSGTFPQTITWDYGTVQTMDRLILRSMPPWQDTGPPVDFDIDTSTNGTAWTNRYTHGVLTTPQLGFPLVSGPWRSTYERYWDEQHIFDVKFTAASVRYVRLVIRASSYGGHTSAAELTTVWGAAWNTIQVVQVAAMFAFSTGL